MISFISLLSFLFELVNECIEIINDKNGCEFNIYSKLSKEIIAITKGILSFFNYLAFLYLYLDKKENDLYILSLILFPILHNINI